MASCPRCGSLMAVRHRRSDGREFLGCTRYPACRGTRGYRDGGYRPRVASATSMSSPSPSQPTKPPASNWPGAIVGLVLIAALVGWCGFGTRTAVSGQGGSGTHPSGTFTAPRATAPPPATIRAASVTNAPTPVPTRTRAATPAPTATPVLPAAGPTAQCRDGTYSYSANHRGTCSHHGGVATWYR